MLTGRNPASGEPLGLKSAPGREPVPGFDLTLSAPKSVSLTWALASHPVSGQVMEAHRAAVESALSYMERNACWPRRGKGGATFVPGNGFLATAYVHRSSGAGGPTTPHPRPRRHATRGPDGRWSRLYHPAIYEHAKTASYLYEAHLLGAGGQISTYEIRRRANGDDVSRLSGRPRRMPDPSTLSPTSASPGSRQASLVANYRSGASSVTGAFPPARPVSTGR
jgi:conjugative relaxase-like TrwC/TraI family protein